MILVVDDYRDAAEALCGLLSRAGYPCKWVPDGPAALAAIRAHPPEQPLLVVLDDMMPQMSGVEVLREIRSDPRIESTIVLFHSAGFDTAHRDEAMTLGAAAWLLKGGSAAGDIHRVIEAIGQWYERAGGAPGKIPSQTDQTRAEDQTD